jgi:type II secretory pathway pseudopilin PulG
MTTTRPFHHNNRGAMIIGLIVAITIIGILSAGTLYFTTSSTQTGLFSNAYSRAYYLAESGIRYARSNEREGITYTANTQFNLENGDAFVIRIIDDPSNSSRIIIYSTGIVHSGSWFESKCDLTSNSPKSGSGENSLTDLSLTVTTEKGKKNKIAIDPRWTFTGGSKLSKIAKAKGSQGEGVIQLTNQKASKGKGSKGKGSKGSIFSAILLSLGWWKVAPENPDLDQAWSENNELLSYEAQVKIKLEGDKGGQGDHFMQGISFRLSPQNPSWTNNSVRSYGISYFKSTDSSWPFDVGLDTSFNAIMNDSDPYIVLWEKINNNNTLALLDYKKLTLSDGVLDGSELEDWATIVVKVEEKFTGPGGTRENHISGFVQGPDTIPQGTIEWDYSDYNIVSWNTNDPQPVLDDSLTTTGFDTQKPDEIGIHAFYESSKENKQYFSDFSLKLDNNSAAEPSYQW